MPSLKQPKMRDHFPVYQKFLAGKKSIDQDRITMRKHERRNNMVGNSPLSYAFLEGEKKFVVEISVENKGNYKLQLWANYFGDFPCFRFDSAGSVHCNPENGSGLRKRQVTTPHFHKFNENGVEIAYKTVKLASQSESDAIVGDCKRGLEHFCQEAKLACNQTAYPSLTLDQEELDLSSDDPLNGVSFS
jgi:hypothetical protein